MLLEEQKFQPKEAIAAAVDFVLAYSPHDISRVWDVKSSDHGNLSSADRKDI